MCRLSDTPYVCGCGTAVPLHDDGVFAGSVRPESSPLARPRRSTTRRCARYILRRLMIDRTTISAVARELGVSWDTVNTIAMDATPMIGRRPHRTSTEYGSLASMNTAGHTPAIARGS